VIPEMPDLSAYPAIDLTTGEDIEESVTADLTKYNPDQERDEHGRFGAGGGATGSTGLSRRDTLLLNSKSDPLVDRVYAAENSARQGQLTRGTLEKPTAPVYPKEAIEQAKANGNTMEALRLRNEYGDKYDKYSKDFDKYQKDFKVVNLQSDLARSTLDGTKAGTQAYINSVIGQDWFKQAYGDGAVMGKLSITTKDVKSYAGQYTSGMSKNEISINNPYTQNEPTIIHEIAHYAQTISATSQYQAHGVAFAETNLHITEKVMGSAAAEKLATAYESKGIKVTNG
jgi:putative metallohydrolase (TIGR04338 family)